MTTSTSSRFDVLRGVIADLAVVSGEQEFVQTTTDKTVGIGLAATLALSGLAGAATGAMLATSGSADSVQFFSCTVDNKRVAGRFSNVWFENGDAVEAVGELQRDGSFAVYAIRRTKDRTLWMFPHCSRGGWAHWAYALKVIPLITVVIAVSVGLVFALAEWQSDTTAPLGLLWVMFWLVLVNSLLIGFYFPLKIARKWRPFVDIAERVFAALGYDHPARVDMEKQNAIYWKKHAKPDEQRRVAPWVFRYVSEK